MPRWRELVVKDLKVLLKANCIFSNSHAKFAYRSTLLWVAMFFKIDNVIYGVNAKHSGSLLVS
jgi:hypothetical protein